MSHALHKQTVIIKKSKFTTVFLTLCLGGFGAHRFYLGNKVLGWTYLIASCLLLIIFWPSLVVITVLLCLEAVYFLCRGKAYYQRTVLMEVVG